jgi:two-component system, LytTR family, sensor kinase
MKLIKPTKTDYQIFLVSICFINFAIMYILYRERIWSDWRVWLFTWGIITIIGYFSLWAHVQYNHFIETKYPTLEKTGARVLYKLLANFFVMSPSIFLVLYLFHAFKIMGYQIREGDMSYAYFTGLLSNIIIGSVLECVYVIDKYKETVAEKELVEKLQLDQEFEKLKEKVNPHFLFNCFNTLSSLISEDKDRAEKFLDELSKVYEDGMSTLESEMKFIESYFQLLKTRHGDAVQLQVDIDEQFNNLQLPSLSLQMLVENVVKHNSLSKNAPLLINIFTSSDNTLAVTNNLQRRSVPAPSNKVGLENIRSKYGLLKHNGFTVMEDEKNFTVVLPLISNNKAAINSATNK